MLSFMKKTVKLVFINALAVLLIAPLEVRADSIFLPSATQKAKVSSHLDFSIVIQPSLLVKVDTGRRSVNPVNNHVNGHAEELQIVSAAIIVQGNSGSIMLNSADSGNASSPVDGFPGTASPHLPADQRELAIMLPAKKQLVHAERRFDYMPAKAGSSARGAAQISNGKGRMVYTVSQL